MTINFEQNLRKIMPEKETGQDVLNVEEKSAIEMRAEARIKTQKLKIQALNLEIPQTSEIKETYEKTKQMVFKEASGEITETEKKSEEELSNEVSRLIAKADKKRKIAPDLSAYLYAEAAKYQEIAGKEFDISFNKANECLKKLPDDFYNSPSSLLPDAILLGISKRQIEKNPLPAKEKIAKNIINDTKLLQDYSLVLPEEERDEFLKLISEEKRKTVSIAMDRAASRVLKDKHIGSELEIKQREEIQKRSEKELSNFLNLSGNETMLYVKMLSQTISELGGDDSAKLLKELGEKGLARGKSAEENKERIWKSARIVRELALLDQNKGSNLAMKFMGKPDLPDHLWLFAAKQMIVGGFMTEKLNKYLEDKNNLSFLKKLIGQYPNQFNTVIDTLSQISNYSLPKNEKEIFSAIEDLESLTPIIYNRYRTADDAGKKELAGKIKELKPKFFQNQPIGEILKKEDKDILAEMVYLAYKPIGMDFQQVKKYLNQLEDRTDDLENYKFPLEGYDFGLENKKSFSLREEEKMDYRQLASFKEMLAGEYPQKEEQAKQFSSLLQRLSKAGTDFSSEELKSLFSVIGADELVRNFLEKYKRVDEQHGYGYLNELKEILGVYFKDNYSARLANFFGANPESQSKLVKILSNEPRQKTFQKKLDNEKEIDWKNVLSSPQELAKILSDFIFSRVIKSIREEISKNFNKFEEREGGETVVASKSNLKAYISKNVGSFFAKASAGICTAEDVELFNREDHFHINIVEDENYIRGNIQAYIISDGGKENLVLRGFNPNTDFLDKINPKIFCEKVIEIAKKFARDNKIDRVYITEDLGGWHALSNRQNVQGYLIDRYKKEKNRRSYHLQIASSQSVDSIYQV